MLVGANRVSLAPFLYAKYSNRSFSSTLKSYSRLLNATHSFRRGVVCSRLHCSAKFAYVPCSEKFDIITLSLVKTSVLLKNSHIVYSVIDRELYIWRRMSKISASVDHA